MALYCRKLCVALPLAEWEGCVRVKNSSSALTKQSIGWLTLMTHSKQDDCTTWPDLVQISVMCNGGGGGVKLSHLLNVQIFAEVRSRCAILGWVEVVWCGRSKFQFLQAVMYSYGIVRWRRCPPHQWPRNIPKSASPKTMKTHCTAVLMVKGLLFIQFQMLL